MKAVKKINQACFLACLESFLSDNGVDIKQDEMIKHLKAKNLCDDWGIVPLDKEGEACKEFNIKMETINMIFPISNKFEDGSLLIGTRGSCLHCFRFFLQPEPEKLVLMDPETGELSWVNKSLIEGLKPTFHRISIDNKTDLPQDKEIIHRSTL